MKTLIIYAHPWEESFNNHVLKYSIEKFSDIGHQVDVIDLHADGFDPVMRPEDLRLYAKGEYHDPLAQTYVNKLKDSDHVIFVFPIWWYDMPAILKGFFDKVMLKNQAYAENEDMTLTGILDVNKSAVFTTANIDKGFFDIVGGPINNTLINGTFKMIGIENATWIHCPTVHLEESRNAFLSEISEYVQSFD